MDQGYTTEKLLTALNKLAQSIPASMIYFIHLMAHVFFYITHILQHSGEYILKRVQRERERRERLLST